MANPLVPCAGCGRHVRASESQCPFCGVTLESDLAARAVPSTTARLGRGAMFVFATTVAIGACAPSPGPSDAASPARVAARSSSASPQRGEASHEAFGRHAGPAARRRAARATASR